MSNSEMRANPKKWLHQYGDTLFQYALTRVYDSGIAEDLVQETFLSALKGLNGYKGEASEKNWLFAILKNKIIDHFRKNYIKYENTPIPELNAVEDEWFDDDGNWKDIGTESHWNDTGNPTERKELLQIIYWCKDNLRNLQRDVFILKYLEDLNADEICKVLRITTSNYWVLVHRARLQMRDCIENKWLKNS